MRIGIKKRRMRAFTLVELMIVLVIIGILMGFAIPEISRSISEAKFNTQQSNLKSLRKKLDEYCRDHGHYPEDLYDLINAPHPYFRELPKDPFTGMANWMVADEIVSGVWLTMEQWRANPGYRNGSYIYDIKPCPKGKNCGKWD